MPIPGADAANEAFTDLTAGVDFTIPEVDLNQPEFELPDSATLSQEIVRIENSDLTEKKIDGAGTFDVLMSALRVHLQKEFEANRITGDQYAKVYIALTEGAMNQAVQFLISRDTAYWQAITAQQQALAAQAQVITARVQLEMAKVQLQSIRAEALTNSVNYALTKMKLATETVGYDAAKYSLLNMLPAQLALLQEQMETARAQTLSTRSDGVTVVAGLLGKQKDLYTQQITSYERDSEHKAAKVFIDAWMTMKTIDEGLLPPTNFNNTSLDAILTTLKTTNNLGT
jgi:hypothetical protein